MKISNSWLQDYLKVDLSINEISDLLTDIGLEVEGVNKYETIKGGLEGIVIGKILTVEKHPDADRLNLTTVDIGEDEPLEIVCGAPNVDLNLKVPVATVGTWLYSGDESFKILKLMESWFFQMMQKLVFLVLNILMLNQILFLK